MATKLYVGRDDSLAIPGAYRGDWNSTAAAETHRMLPHRVGPPNIITGTDANATANWDVCVYRGVSDPLKGSGTLAGTLEAILYFRESNAAANDVLHVHAYVWNPGADTVRGALLTDYIGSTEFVVSTTTLDAISMSAQTLNSVNYQDGDRIVVELGFQAQNSVSTSYTAAIKLGGAGPDATGSDTGIAVIAENSPFVSFSQDVSFKPTYLWLNDQAADATPGAWEYSTYNDTASAVTKKLGQAMAGPVNAIVSIAETSLTNPYKIANGRFVSDQLAAQTVAGTVTLMEAMIESTAAMDAFGILYIWLMKPDGTKRAELFSGINAVELPTSNIGRLWTVTLTSQAASNGDRIVIERGASATNADATSRTAQLYYGYDGQRALAVAQTLTNGGKWVRFDSGLDFGYVAPAERAFFLMT